MPHYEYKVAPAPSRPQKAKGARTPEARFAAALGAELNAAAEDGWEFLRAETLPVEERTGLTGTRTAFRSVLVYRRAVGPDDAEATRAAMKLLEDRSGDEDG